MARLLGPSQADRLVYAVSGTTLRTAAQKTALVYADAAGTTLADILAYDGTQTPGAAVAGSVLTVDAYSLLPLFWYPDGATEVWVRVNGGPLTPLAPAGDAQDLADLAATVAALDAADVGADPAGAAAAVQSTVDALTAADVGADPAGTAVTLDDFVRAVGARLPRPQALAVGNRSGTLDLYQRVGAVGWWRSSLPPVAITGGGTVNVMRDQAFCVAVALVGAAAGGVTTSGSWTTGGNAGAFGGSFYHASVAGAYKEWTSPDGSTVLSLVTFMTSNGGLGKVSIDGDPTLANGCPTAQDVVDSGLYPDTILVANGGILNPTDRVVSTYSVTVQPYVDVIIADRLTAAAHTVRWEATGYSPTASPSSQRAYIEAFGANSGQQLNDAGTVVAAQPISADTSVWEYALKFQPSGQTAQFVGNGHGYETQTSLAVYVDNALSTPASGTVVLVTDNVRITRTTWLTHPDITPTKAADVVTEYRLSRTGLAVDNTVTWAVGGTLTADYAMLPLPGSLVADRWQRFDRGDMSHNGAGPVTLTGVAGDVGLATSPSGAGWVWQSTGRFAAAVWLDNPAEYLRNYVATSFVEDRDGTLAKVYLQRSTGAAPETVVPGSTRTARARYAFCYLGSPHTVLAGTAESASVAALPLTGGTLTGPLILSAGPATGLQAATKTYADTVAAARTADIQTFTAAGTWTNPSPTVPRLVHVRWGGGGSGGGSGRRGAAGTVRQGGGGGAPGLVGEGWMLSTDLPATVAVTVGAGGAGGAAQTADDTDGNPGTNGGGSFFGAAASTYRIGNGAPSTTARGAGGSSTGTPTGGSSNAGSPVGGAVSATGAVGAGGGTPTMSSGMYQGAPAGGGAGGGVTSGDATSAGGAGGALVGMASGGAGGTSGGGAGADGAAGPAGTLAGGLGGGGGGSSTSGAGGSGGAGALYGAGGGGGGASTNGSNSGAGGGGAAGFVRVVTYA